MIQKASQQLNQQPSSSVFNPTGFNHHQGKSQQVLESVLTVKAIKGLIAEQLDLAKHKDALIFQTRKQCLEIQAQVQQAAQKLVSIEKEIEAMSKYDQLEQEKTEEERAQDMHIISNALKIQQQVLGMYQGLPQECIESIPLFQFEKGTTDSQICLACFQSFEHQTPVKSLPCGHTFHQLCIDQFLAASKYCPACSEEVVLSL